MINNFNEEELKTFIGCLMADLRGAWGCNDFGRVNTLKKSFMRLWEIFNDSEEDSISDMIELCDEVLNEDIPSGEFDGRTFRGEYLYQYTSEEGSTQRVAKELSDVLVYPKYCKVCVDWGEI